MFISFTPVGIGDILFNNTSSKITLNHLIKKNLYRLYGLQQNIYWVILFGQLKCDHFSKLYFNLVR
jgi:hypothetical protein